MPHRRYWYGSLIALPLTVVQTVSTFRAHRMGGFLPLAALLFACAGILWAVNAIAPLAPFIYSLF